MLSNDDLAEIKMTLFYMQVLSPGFAEHGIFSLSFGQNISLLYSLHLVFIAIFSSEMLWMAQQTAFIFPGLQIQVSACTSAFFFAL